MFSKPGLTLAPYYISFRNRGQAPAKYGMMQIRVHRTGDTSILPIITTHRTLRARYGLIILALEVTGTSIKASKT